MYIYKFILRGFIERVLELFKLSPSNNIYAIVKQLDLLFNVFQYKRKRRKGIVSHKVHMSTLGCDYSPLIYKHKLYELFTKTLKIIFIYINAHQPQNYVCNCLDLYISLDNDFKDLITLINKVYQYIN